METYYGEFIMAKRMKLKRIVAGESTKQIYGTILSGSNINNINLEIWSDVYIAGQEGNLFSTTQPLTADETLYNVGYFDRQYSIQNPNINNGCDLKVNPTDSDIMDMIQFGDYAFNLTNETSLGTEYNLMTTQTIGNSWYYNTHDEVYKEPHEIAIYPTTGDLSGQLADGSDELSGVAQTIKYLPFNITPERPDIVFGYMSGGELFVYVKDLSANSDTVYSLSGGLLNSLPFTYLMEQSLNNSLTFGRDGFAYGGVSGSNLFVYSPLVSGGTADEVYSPYPEDANKFEIYYNPFKLKNMYNYNWNCEYDAEIDEMKGARDYLKVGKSQEHLWLSYKYYRDYPTSVQEFELVERVGGLYKYRPIEGHKSNIYSIRIFNSGLNEGLDNTDEQKVIQTNLRNIIDTTIRNVVKKIAPSSTQLWKVDWVGR